MWPAILWNGMEKAGENINGGDSINMAYTFCWNWYRGIKSPQIIIEDIVKAPGGNYA
jgi:hypothetical protein